MPSLEQYILERIETMKVVESIMKHSNPDAAKLALNELQAVLSKINELGK